MSILRNGHVVVSNLRVKTPLLSDVIEHYTSCLEKRGQSIHVIRFMGTDINLRYLI